VEHVEKEARTFAETRHGSQRYGADPYVLHLAAVREVLRAFGHDGELGVAAWLHDVLEDTATTRDEVRMLFGDEVEALVWAVTGVGKDRKERNAAAYAKIRAKQRAATLKLADRIANAEASRARADKLAMYRAELPGFEEALAGLGEEAMWKRLREALAGPT